MSTPTLSDLPIRRLTPRDLTGCADLAAGRGWPRDEHKWGLLLAAGTAHGIDDPDGGLVSACTVTSYGSPDRPDLQAIGMMLVAERHARKGVGRRLMRHVIESAGTTPLTLYATPKGRPLYEKLGFKVLGEADMLSGHLSTEAEESAALVRSAVAADLAGILRLDGEVFGTDRTQMITRLPAFADHLHVTEEEGRLSGYAGAWPAGETHVVGPLVARDTGTAKALLASLASVTDRPLRTDIDVRHKELLAWGREHGLAHVASNKIMIYGASNLPGDWKRRFAPLTVAAG